MKIENNFCLPIVLHSQTNFLGLEKKRKKKKEKRKKKRKEEAFKNWKLRKKKLPNGSLLSFYLFIHTYIHIYIYNYIKSASNIPQQRCITQATKVTSGATATNVRCTSQATRVTCSAVVADGKCTGQATKAALADKGCTAQSIRLTSNGLMSIEVLEMLEAMPDHEFFIQ